MWHFFQLLIIVIVVGAARHGRHRPAALSNFRLAEFLSVIPIVHRDEDRGVGATWR